MATERLGILMDHVDALAPGAHAVVLDGTLQRYHVFGSGPVCIVHSGGPGIEWEASRMPAIEADLTTIYVEPIGTGGSGRLTDHPNGYSIDRYSHCVHELIKYLRVPRVHFLGHSHGGFVAQRYALEHPERLASMILYDSAPAAGAELFAEATRNIEAFAVRNSHRPVAQSALEAWRKLGSVSTDEATTAALRQLLPAFFASYWDREQELERWCAAVRCAYVSSGSSHFDNSNGLSSIKIPTLVIVGRHDVICGPRWAQVLHEGIAGSVLVILENSGHLGHLEEPDTFANAVVTFTGKLVR
jgi:proline iminopeptidase